MAADWPPAYLRQLLLKQGAYRQAVGAACRPGPAGEINQLAVAEVLARYLWSIRRRPATPRHAASAQGHRFPRAVGRLLSRPRWHCSSTHSASQRRRPTGCGGCGTGPARSRCCPAAGPCRRRSRSDLRKALGPRRHQTLSLHDHVYVGADGRLEQDQDHAGDRGDRRRGRPDPVPVRHQRADRGGRPGLQGVSGSSTSRRRACSRPSILLARTLNLGETSTLEYWTTYRCRAT